MPTFEFLCEKCGHRFDLLVRSADAAASCPGCASKKVVRQYTVFGLNLGASPDRPAYTPCGCGKGG